MEFPVVYASALQGTSGTESDELQETMDPVFETIMDHIPAPKQDIDGPLQYQITLLDYNDYVGRIGIGRIFRGRIKVGDSVSLIKKDGTVKNFRVTKLFGFLGLKRTEIQEAQAGDIVAIAGVEDLNVGETVVTRIIMTHYLFHVLMSQPCR